MVAQGVVQLLEVVEVEHEHAEPALGPTIRDLRLEPLEEVTSVGEPGEVVGHRLPAGGGE